MSAKAKTSMPASSRRRSFLASRQDENLAASAQTDKTAKAAKAEEDIPLLTEVVPESLPEPVLDKASPETSVAIPPSPPPTPGTLEEFAEQMIQAIQEQMAYELPTLVEASLLSAREELRKGIASTMEAALRDFVARHK